MILMGYYLQGMEKGKWNLHIKRLGIRDALLFFMRHVFNGREAEQFLEVGRWVRKKGCITNNPTIY